MVGLLDQRGIDSIPSRVTSSVGSSEELTGVLSSVGSSGSLGLELSGWSALRFSSHLGGRPGPGGILTNRHSSTRTIGVLLTIRKKYRDLA